MPLLLVWVNVFSLIPWLSDVHTVRFSVTSGCFLFLNLLLSLFWLCEEAKYIYLCLHLGQKSATCHILRRKNVSALGTCSGLILSRAYMSHEAASEEKMLYHLVLTGFGTHHKFQNGLTMSTKVPLYYEGKINVTSSLIGLIERNVRNDCS